MSFNIEKTCRLCMNLTENDCALIDSLTRTILNTLCLKIDLSINVEPLMCKQCKMTLHDCFDFVSMCQNLADPSFSNVQESFQTQHISDQGSNSCLFCKQTASNNPAASLRNFEDDIVVLRNSLALVIFNLYATASEEPILCQTCQNSLRIYLEFSKNCLVVERKILDKYENKQFQAMSADDRLISVETENLHSVTLNVIKEESYNGSGQNISEKIDNMPIKKEDLMDFSDLSVHTVVKINDDECGSGHCCWNGQLVPEDGILYKCNTCPFVATQSTTFSKHPSTEVPLFKCPDCPFQTAIKRYLTKHSRKHLPPEEIPTFKCELCPFATKHKWYLSTHALLHKNTSEVQMYQCRACPYATKNPKSLKRHLSNHDENLSYACDKCSYVTKQRVCLRKHAVTHQDPSYECDFCSYRCRFKRNLTVHLLVHQDASQVVMYKCTYCDYKTKKKDNLALHAVIHMEKSEVRVFNCEHCNYETKRKSNLYQHMVVHKARSETPMFKCAHCDYQSKRKTNLKQHLNGVHNRWE